MRTWFESLAARERMLVLAGALLLVALLFYSIIWSPLFDRNANLKENLESQQETLVWMQQAAGKIKTLQRAAGGSAGGLGGRSLLAVVDESARGSGLGSSIKRIEPDTAKGAKVWLEGASFDQMILWLGQLGRQYQVEITSISIEPLGTGLVNARISLLEAAA